MHKIMIRIRQRRRILFLTLWDKFVVLIVAGPFISAGCLAPFSQKVGRNLLRTLTFSGSNWPRNWSCSFLEQGILGKLLNFFCQ